MGCLRIILLFAVIKTAFSGTPSDPFQEFLQQFHKTYRTADQLERRRTIFLENFHRMVDHNQRYKDGEVTWWQKVHEDMDLTTDEWLVKRTGGVPHYDNNTGFHDNLDQRIMNKLQKMGPAPRSFEWVSKGKVSSVKDQGQCGSCTAFSALAATESCYAIVRGIMEDDLSEQHLLDCAYYYEVNDQAGSWGCHGCKGGWTNAYIDWMMQGHQNQEESFYPYTSGTIGNVTACNPKSNGYYTGARVTGMYNRWYPNELDMENLVQINPVSTLLATTGHWHSYGGGVLNDPSCCNAADDHSCVYRLNHAILVVGYGTENGLDYWLIKNSWGANWGDHGYLKLKKGTGHCGVGSLQQNIPYCS